MRTLKIARAYQVRPAFQNLHEQASPEQVARYLKRWHFWATPSRLEPIIDAARAVKRHWDGIRRRFDSRIANGLIEGINSLVQAAKSKARGYRSIRNLKARSICWPASSTCGCPHEYVASHVKRRGT